MLLYAGKLIFIIHIPVLALFEQKNYTSVCGGMNMDCMTLKEASEKWGVSSRQVNYYCVDGRIPGAVKMAGVWLLPKDAVKPVDGRTKEGRAQK